MINRGYIHTHCVWPNKQINVDVYPTISSGITGDFQEVTITFLSSVRVKRNKKYYKVFTIMKEMFTITVDSHKNTIEFLIFKGSLKTESFYKNIEFCFCLYAFVKTASLCELTKNSFCEYVKVHQKTYRNLFTFLTKKGLL